jgi:hypothetical protein
MMDMIENVSVFVRDVTLDQCSIYLFQLFQHGPYLSIVRDSCGLSYQVLGLNVRNRMSDKIVVRVSSIAVGVEDSIYAA